MSDPLQSSDLNRETPSSVKGRLKNLAFRMMRPGLRTVHEDIALVRDDIQSVRERLDMFDKDQRKYDGELEYWRWLIKKGGSEKDFGRPFEDIFGHWVRQRLIKLGVFLGLPRVGEPGDIDDWAAVRSVIEIGAGPYPSIAAAKKGWLRCVAVDPIARGYVEEDLIAKAAEKVVYIEAPGERIPLPCGFADLIIIENCLDHVRDPSSVIREMHRLLKPGGHVWLFVDLSNHVDHMHPHAMNEDKVRAFMNEFEIVRDEVTGHKAHPQAYGSYRGLLRRKDAERRVVPSEAQSLRQSESGSGANNGTVVEVKNGLSLNGSAADRPRN